MVSKPARNRPRSRWVIRFIERPIVPSGLGAGAPLRLRPWQQAFFRHVYEPRQRNGSHVVRRAVLSVGRKNGKSALTAALVLAHLVGPEATRNGEIYSAATERELAATVFKIAAQMVPADPELRAKSMPTRPRSIFPCAWPSCTFLAFPPSISGGARGRLRGCALPVSWSLI